MLAVSVLQELSKFQLAPCSVWCKLELCLHPSVQTRKLTKQLLIPCICPECQAQRFGQVSQRSSRRTIRKSNRVQFTVQKGLTLLDTQLRSLALRRTQIGSCDGQALRAKRVAVADGVHRSDPPFCSFFRPNRTPWSEGAPNSRTRCTSHTPNSTPSKTEVGFTFPELGSPTHELVIDVGCCRQQPTDAPHSPPPVHRRRSSRYHQALRS